MTGAADRQGRVGIGRGRDPDVPQNGNIQSKDGNIQMQQSTGLSQPNGAVVLEGGLFDWVKREGGERSRNQRRADGEEEEYKRRVGGEEEDEGRSGREEDDERWGGGRDEEDEGHEGDESL